MQTQRAEPDSLDMGRERDRGRPLARKNHNRFSSAVHSLSEPYTIRGHAHRSGRMD